MSWALTCSCTIARHWSGGVAGSAPTVPQISPGMYSGTCGVVTVQDRTAWRRCGRTGYRDIATLKPLLRHAEVRRDGLSLARMRQQVAGQTNFQAAIPWNTGQAYC